MSSDKEQNSSIDIEQVGGVISFVIAVLFILYEICNWIFGFFSESNDISLLDVMLDSGRGIVIWFAAIGFVLYAFISGFQNFPILMTGLVFVIILYKLLF